MRHRPHIIFTVTNDLTYDQRMQRICSTLATAGYEVTLVGRALPDSAPLDDKLYRQVRLTCKYHQGKLFYLEYNWRLSRYLYRVAKSRSLKAPLALCAIDLDTILPILRVSKKYGLERVYDAHELFTELTEVKRRPVIAAIWQWVEQTAVPKFKNGYTVNGFIAGELARRYQVDYKIIRNLPRQKTEIVTPETWQLKLPRAPFFLYQGAVNEGRCFETLIPAMKMVEANLVIAGNGNYFEQAKQLSIQFGVTDKVHFLGYVKPGMLRALTPGAYAGITLFENTGLNQYYSLANRYFDYIQAGIPQLCVNYPEYAAINQQFETALLIGDLSPESIAASLNKLLSDDVLYNRLKQHCVKAGNMLCWEIEAEKLVAYWNTLLPINSPGE